MVESQTGTYIVDCCRVNGYTNSGRLYVLVFYLCYLKVRLGDSLKAMFCPLFLGIGIRPAIFQASGNIPSEKDRLNKTARGSDMVLDTALSIRLLIPSSPLIYIYTEQ